MLMLLFLRNRLLRAGLLSQGYVHFKFKLLSPETFPRGYMISNIGHACFFTPLPAVDAKF